MRRALFVVSLAVVAACQPGETIILRGRVIACAKRPQNTLGGIITPVVIETEDGDSLSFVVSGVASAGMRGCFKLPKNFNGDTRGRLVQCPNK